MKYVDDGWDVVAEEADRNMNNRINWSDYFGSSLNTIVYKLKNSGMSSDTIFTVLCDRLVELGESSEEVFRKLKIGVCSRCAEKGLNDVLSINDKEVKTMIEEGETFLFVKLAGHEGLSAFKNKTKTGNQPDYKADGIAVWVKQKKGKPVEEKVL